MALLNFESLQKKFELKKTKGKVRIFLFSKGQDSYIIHSKDSRLMDFLESNRPIGNVGECYYRDTDVLCCIGPWDAKELVRRNNVRKAMGPLYGTLKRFNNFEIVFEECEFLEDAIFSLILSSYSYDFLKKKQDEYAFFLNAPKYTKIIRIAHAQNIARFLGDTPANLMTPSLFVEYAKKILEGENIEIKEYSRDFMIENEMNLILSVAQGSTQEPKLLQVRYMGKNSGGVDLALVGKGVCFDSGGISIKPSAGMYSMKHDMMGAATLLCSIKVAASLGLKIDLVGTFPLVENLPSGTATKPGDVFKSMSGTTVEVDNTDAEGRLILADALTFAQRESPRHMINAATLTGAMAVSLGTVYAGYFTTDQAFSDMIYESGIKTNDLMWRMPLSPYYREALKSHVADINNMGGRDGGSCKAAEFLKEFVDTAKTTWAHFDIAGVMNKSYLSEMYGKETTGRPVPVFVDLIEKLEKMN